MSIAVYPGSFDPITLGHIDILARASKLFGHVILAVGNHSEKESCFDLASRVALATESCRHLSNVTVESFEGLTVTFAEEKGAQVIIRGLRAVSDFEYEFKMSQMNKQLCPSLETMFLMASQEHHFVSSSVLREVAALGGDVSQNVPAPVLQRLKTLQTCQ